MNYNNIKKLLSKYFNKKNWLRLLFYRLLELLLLRSWYVRRELRKWLKNAPQNAAVLDAGSGLGQYSWRIAKMGKKMTIIGNDINQDNIDDCNKFFHKLGFHDTVIFKQNDITQLKEKEIYNLVLLIDVLEHIEDDQLVLNNLYQSLRPNGSLILTTPSDLGGSAAKNHTDLDDGFIDEHVRNGYNKTELVDKLKRAGFTKINAKYIYGIPGNIAWILSMKIPIILLNKSPKFLFLLPFYYIITYPISFILNCLDTVCKHKSGTGIFVSCQL
ncbi:MAG: class I SAM-dependent methyltransferase [Marinilabiliaceae bacterium]|nr:class I SAM-dependent methyltransferase [Marinilabiliaceae bacterium]